MTLLPSAHPLDLNQYHLPTYLLVIFLIICPTTLYLSSCPREVQSPFEWRGGAGDYSQVTAGQIDLI